MLKLISLNIYGDRYLDRQIEFFQREQADVICLQEVFAIDLPIFEKSLGMVSSFVSLTDIREENEFGDAPRGKWGIAILSRSALATVQTAFYQYESAEESLFPSKGKPDTCARAILWADIQKENRVYTVATTHFTWAPDENPTPVQLEALAKLQKILQRIPKLVLTGDFNAKRGYPIFDSLARELKDNIPNTVSTTIDQELHRKKGLQLVIDGLFTRGHTARNVRVVSGVSDHCAIVGEIE